MKRMHIHLAVTDLEQSVRFYSTLFAASPTVIKPDYAKWMLDDPCVNFAISARGLAPGVDHLGIQVDSTDDLRRIHDCLEAAGEAMVTQQQTTCCYARSDKHWVTDPEGIAWETFHTLDEAPTFGSGRPSSTEKMSACCGGAARSAAAPSCCG